MRSGRSDRWPPAPPTAWRTRPRSGLPRGPPRSCGQAPARNHSLQYLAAPNQVGRRHILIRAVGILDVARAEEHAAESGLLQPSRIRREVHAPASLLAKLVAQLAMQVGVLGEHQCGAQADG